MKCIVFDFDGTIFQSRNVAIGALNKSLNELGLCSLGHSLVNTPIFNPEILIKILSMNRCLSDDVENNLLSIYKNNLFFEERSARIDESIVSALRILSENDNYILAIYSDRKTDNLTSLLKYKNLYELFSEICGRDMMKPKPSNEFIAFLKEKYNIDSNDIIFIGDTDIDYFTAKNAGVYYVHTKYSDELSNFSWKYCNKMINSPKELKEYLLNLVQL